MSQHDHGGPIGNLATGLGHVGLSRFFLAFVLALALSAVAHAHQSTIAVSPNVNVLPGITDQIQGDLFLQRQNEPVVAVSTRNPDHVMVAMNDYRTVDLANDQGLGETILHAARSVAGFLTHLLAWSSRSEELERMEEAE